MCLAISTMFCIADSFSCRQDVNKKNKLPTVGMKLIRGYDAYIVCEVNRDAGKNKQI